MSNRWMISIRRLTNKLHAQTLCDIAKETGIAKKNDCAGCNDPIASCIANEPLHGQTFSNSAGTAVFAAE
jgi:hypothetical protein